MRDGIIVFGNRLRHLRLGVGLSIRVLRALDLTPDHILSNIILLAQVEEPPDLGGPLRTEPLGENIVRQTGKLVLALLHNDKGKNGDIRTNDAATNGFPFALTSATRTVARVAVRQKELDTGGEKNALFHGETLLVIAASNTEDVAFEFIPKGVGRDLL